MSAPRLPLSMSTTKNATKGGFAAEKARGTEWPQRSVVVPILAPVLSAFLMLPTTVIAASEKAAPAPVGIGGMLQMLLALLLVVGLIVGLALLMRRFGAVPTGAEGAIRLIGGIAIGARERIVVVQVGETQLLLGVAPGQIRTLHVLDKPIATPPGASKGDFAQRLAAAMRRGGTPS